MDRCPCDRCNSRETGAWEDEPSEFPTPGEVQAAWDAYYEEQNAAYSELFEVEDAWYWARENVPTIT